VKTLKRSIQSSHFLCRLKIHSKGGEKEGVFKDANHLPFLKKAKSSFRQRDMYDKVNKKKPNARASACRRRDLSIGIVYV
jgi:hypothetical protein